MQHADVVIAVGGPGIKGLAGLVRTVHDLREHGVPPLQILAVVNGASRNVRARAELTRSFAELTDAAYDDEPVVGPIFLPDRRGIDDLHRDGARLPAGLSTPLVGAVQAMITGAGNRAGIGTGSALKPVRRDHSARGTTRKRRASERAAVRANHQHSASLPRSGSAHRRPAIGARIKAPHRASSAPMSEPQVELNPLVEIERAVQKHAKDIALDLGRGDAEAKLRSLIDDEVDRWSADHKRGLRAFDLADPEAVAERAFRNLAGYGPLEPLLDDDDVWEIMINAPDAIFVKRHRGPERLPRRGLPRRRPRRPHPHQDPRRRLVARTASSTPPRACRTRSSTTAPASTSCTATSAAAATSW